MTDNTSAAAIDARTLDRAQTWLQQADALIITAGAGMGVDSGLPDFRGAEGFWRAYPALKQSYDFYQIASPDAFHDNPELAWGFYGHRLNLYRDTEPHAGFALLKTCAAKKPHGCHVITSNVDGQFQRAGFDPQRIYECHGSIHHLQCLQPCTSTIWPADSYKPEVDQDRCQLISALPICTSCGQLARPNILMFNDYGWLDERSDRQAKQLQRWLQQTRAPLIVELGAGLAVPTIRHLGESIARNHDNARLIRINPRDCDLPRDLDALTLPCGALAGLQALIAKA